MPGNIINCHFYEKKLFNIYKIKMFAYFITFFNSKRTLNNLLYIKYLTKYFLLYNKSNILNVRKTKD